MTEVKAKFPGVSVLEVQEVLKANGTKGVVIDIREPKELVEDGRVPGFINIPLKDVQKAFAMHPEEFKLLYNVSKPDPEKDVVFSCRSGRRAVIGAEKLQELGTYPNIKVFYGSFQEWFKQGNPIVQGPLPDKGADGSVGDRKKQDSKSEDE